MTSAHYSKFGFLLAVAFLGLMTGCIGYVDEPRHTRGYGPAPPVYVEREIVVQDDYVYYPAYQVYYSGARHHYVYRDGRSWVSRPAPPRVAVDVLLASPSVRVDFHDHPSAHHAAMVQTYPGNWTPPGWNHGKKEGRGEVHGKGNGRNAEREFNEK